MIKSKLTRIRPRTYSIVANFQKGAFLFGFATASNPVVLSTDEDGDGSSLVQLDDDPEAVTAAHWPTAGIWRIRNTKNGDAFDGRGLIYGEDGGTRKVLIAPIDGPHDEPEHIIEPQTIDGKAPDLIFLGA